MSICRFPVSSEWLQLYGPCHHPVPECLFLSAGWAILRRLDMSYRVVFAHLAPVPESLTTTIMLIMSPDRTSVAGRHHWRVSYKVLWRRPYFQGNGLCERQKWRTLTKPRQNVTLVLTIQHFTQPPMIPSPWCRNQPGGSIAGLGPQDHWSNNLAPTKTTTKAAFFVVGGAL